MTVTPNTSFQIGGVAYPLPSSITNSLLQDADPSLFLVLDFAKYVVNTYVGPRLVAAASNLSSSFPAILAAGQPIAAGVAQAFPYAPATQYLDTQLQFPLLAAYRKRGLTGRLTASYEHDRTYFDLVYALPPLDAAGAERLTPVLAAVAQALRYKFTQGVDANYTPPYSGAVAGSYVWGGPPAESAGLGPIESVGFGDPFRDFAEAAEYIFLEGSSDLFPAVLLRGYFVERDMPTGAGPTLAGGDFDLQLVSADQTRIDDFVQVSTQAAPTVVSLSVSTGSHSGGTSVTITGTNFLKAPLVWFGSTPATSVVWNSATSVTCSTPAVGGASSSAVDVTVQNTVDGQSGVLLAAFTYT